MPSRRPRSYSVHLLFVVVLVSLAVAAPASAADPPADTNVQFPSDYSAQNSYHVVVSPGDFYWGDPGDHPGWIVVTSGAFYGPGRIERSVEVLDWLEANHPPRGGRFHIAGWSANSAGVFEIAAAYPERFHSVTGIAGMPGRGAESQLDRYESMRVQFIVGENDSYWRRGSEEWHRKMSDQGIDSTLEIIPNGPHVMEELIGKPIFERLDQVADPSASPP